MKLGVLAGAGVALSRGAGEAKAQIGSFELAEMTISRMREEMRSGTLTSADLVRLYSERVSVIDGQGPAMNSVLEINPEAAEIASTLDGERDLGRERGPLHGVPVFVKDNIDTADSMTTTAGSLALEGSVAKEDATVAARLREAGAVILGKTNLSEWANFRSTQSSSGWSSRGGQSLNPYSLDRSPSGSSSGSASAVAANLAAASLGTETNGSILSPAAANGVVGLKPTVGLTSRAGVIPIAESQDTVGPIARTVEDAAIMLGALAGPDFRDPATREGEGNSHSDYTRFLDPDGLRGARIGVSRDTYFGYSPEADEVTEAAIEEMRNLGAEVVDPADIPTAAEMAGGDAGLTVLLYEFKDGINKYLSTLEDGFPETLEELISFNEDNRDRVMPYFGQELFEQAQEKGPLTDEAYKEALEESRRLSRADGIDAVMDEKDLDALVAPTGSPAVKVDLINGDHFLGASSTPSAMAGYPAITVPAGHSFGLPIGLTFTGRAFSEPTLIKLAYAFERATLHRRPPDFLPSVEGLPFTGGPSRFG
ncbi:MAG: amidase [Rubrobacteraceae bacterium]